MWAHKFVEPGSAKQSEHFYVRGTVTSPFSCTKLNYLQRTNIMSSCFCNVYAKQLKRVSVDETLTIFLHHFVVQIEHSVSCVCLSDCPKYISNYEQMTFDPDI